ncbi:hypothetical protein EJP82_20910 [Paenibacillus anaericanus]|uniref:Uncharacterized protein n=1 Tax=Paenibacillus anaericanus TaxID=170367 RepID=A0A433Y4Q1_9BACL|nr:hypothetical protein [Paenibacillus anaericanus]RUT43277.1 hypothetical protein EJP82_20910 [Paenibacillus anaericanus]
MKKIVLLLTGIIIISNAIWSYVYFKEINKASNSGIQVYNLNGTGEIWDVINYKIIVSPTKIQRGNGRLVYKGDSKNIENSTYYKYEIKEINIDDKYGTVFVNEASSKGGPVSILSNLNDTGSIIGEFSYDELKKDKQNYESTTITITWNDNEGRLHSETVNLDIDSEIVLNDE